jgi:multimeric flavodoxin WrbA
VTIFGFSSSPVVGGNVDRMVHYILENSGRTYEFVNLTEKVYSPCRACAQLCSADNVCKLDDDLKPYYPKLMEAEAIVLGTPSYFDNLNGFMAVFLERLWSFRHQRFPLKGKPYVVVASGGETSPEQAIESIKRRMNAYEACFLGELAYHSSIVPCLMCGFGKVCEVGASQRIYGTDGRKKLRIRKELFKGWEYSTVVQQQINKLCEKLKAALDRKRFNSSFSKSRGSL